MSPHAGWNTVGDLAVHTNCAAHVVRVCEVAALHVENEEERIALSWTLSLAVEGLCRIKKHAERLMRDAAAP